MENKITNNIELVGISRTTAGIIDSLDPEWKKYSIMMPSERMFLAEMVRRVQPRTMVEIGTYGGGGSTIMLQSSIECEGRLASVDISRVCYDKRNIPCGYALTMFPELKERWQGYFGHRVSAYVNDIVNGQFDGNTIDFVCLDSQHQYPGEMLDFICVFPYLSPNATIVMHDAALEPLNVHLFSILHGKKYLPAQQEFPEAGKVADRRILESGQGTLRTLIPNIGAVTLDDTQRDHMYDLFHMLWNKWRLKLPSDEVQTITENLCKNYDNYLVQMWSKILTYQGH